MGLDVFALMEEAKRLATGSGKSVTETLESLVMDNFQKRFQEAPENKKFEAMQSIVKDTKNLITFRYAGLTEEERKAELTNTIKGALGEIALPEGETFKKMEPLANKAMDKIIGVIASDEFATLTEDQFRFKVIGAAQEQLQTIPVPERYAAFKDVVGTITPLLGDEATGKLKAITDKLDSAGPAVQEALGHAIAQNPHFLNYLIEESMNAGDGGFAQQTINKLFQNTDGTPHTNAEGELTVNTQFAGPVTDILVTIGNNPDVDYTAQIEGISNAVSDYSKALASGSKADQREAAIAMHKSMREMGASIHAFAAMDLSIVMEFLKDLFTPGVGAKGALDRMAANLGLEGEQLAEFHNKLDGFAGMLEFGAQEIVQVQRTHGISATDIIDDVTDTIETFSGGDRPVINDPTAVVPAPDLVIGGMTAEQFHAAAMDKAGGIEIMTADQAMELAEAIDPKMADEMLSIQSSVTLKEGFDDATEGQSPEVVAARLIALREGMVREKSLADGVDAMTPIH